MKLNADPWVEGGRLNFHVLGAKNFFGGGLNGRKRIFRDQQTHFPVPVGGPFERDKPLLELLNNALLSGRRPIRAKKNNPIAIWELGIARNQQRNGINVSLRVLALYQPLIWLTLCVCKRSNRTRIGGATRENPTTLCEVLLRESDSGSLFN